MLVPTASAAQAVDWCGGSTAATDRLPDAVNGLQWHVVYAFPADGADNFGSMASAIATDLEAINAWWGGQDPARQFRFDLHAFPGCPPGLARLDISRAQLPNGSGHYSIGGDERVNRLVADLNAAPFNFTDPDKKYLVYYDGPVEEPNVCGKGNAGIIDGGPKAFAIVFLGACTNTDVGSGNGGAAITAVHEMTHALNALPFPFPSPGPPNVCPGDQGHPCEEGDLMFPQGTAEDTLSSKTLDVGRDDYYGHGGPWWDTQDSLFFVHLDKSAAAPTGPKKLNITSVGKKVTVSWPKARGSGVLYRVYRNGVLARFARPASPPFATTKKRKQVFGEKRGKILIFGVRAVSKGGLLGPLKTVRFKVGFGIVNAKGKVIKDTVPPPVIKRIRFSQSGAGITFRWGKVKDTVSKIRGYIVERNGKRFKLVTTNSITVPLATARARWSVRPVDAKGNVAARAGILTLK